MLGPWPSEKEPVEKVRVWIISSTSHRWRKWATSLYTIQSIANECRGSAVDSCLNNWPAALELLRLGAGGGAGCMVGFNTAMSSHGCSTRNRLTAVGTHVNTPRCSERRCWVV